MRPRGRLERTTRPAVVPAGHMLASHVDHRLKLSPEQPGQNPHLVKPTGRPRHRTQGTPLSEGAVANALWCADFKGEFKLGNGQCCYPLTVTDHASRFLLLCRARAATPRTNRGRKTAA